ncbi:transcriptional regulator [Xenophilus aerolatus]|nr:transcriptional regulator [Xenophilus aerolatus]
MVQTNSPEAHFGARLREERKRLRMNQTEFAGLAALTNYAQLSYEKGTRSPDAKYLQAIATHGVDVLYLLTGARQTPTSNCSCQAASAGPDAEAVYVLKGHLQRVFGPATNPQEAARTVFLAAAATA